MEYLTIDRIENGWAVLEHSEGTFNVPLHWLPEAAGEGDVLRVETEVELDPHPEQSGVFFYINEGETQKRLEQARELRGSLPRGPEGDLEL